MSSITIKLYNTQRERNKKGFNSMIWPLPNKSRKRKEMKGKKKLI